MKKTFLFSSFSQAVGIILGITGLSFLIYSLYILFFTPLKDELINILPEKNFEFILVAGENTANIPKNVITQFPFPIPEKGALVSYHNEETQSSDFIAILPDSSEKIPLSSVECVKTNHYQFCSTSNESVTLYKVIEAIKNKEASLRAIELFTNTDDPFFSKSSYSFAGRTSFLKKNITSLPLPLTRDNVFVENVVALSTDILPYFSGNISMKKNEYTILFHKKEKGDIFPSSLAKYPLSESLIHPSSTRYLYMKKPQFFLDFVSQNSTEQSFPQILEIFQEGKEWTLSIFDHKASWKNDVEPLLLTDILFTQSDFGNALFASLPSQEMGESFYSQYKTILQNISEEKIPEKKGFPLKDGTMIYEIFPSKKDVELEEQQSSKGNISIFTIHNSDSPQKFISSIAQKENVLSLADNKKNAEFFWNPKNKKSNFSLSLDKNTFFSFGFYTPKGEKQLHTSSVIDAEITGTETDSSLLFTGKIKWNPDFFTKPAISTIEDVEGSQEETQEDKPL